MILQLLQAAELLRAILPDVWRRSVRMQRLRLITHEETCWRAQVGEMRGTFEREGRGRERERREGRVEGVDGLMG